MDDLRSLSYTRWECNYHVVFIPKYRRKTLFGQLRKELGRVLALLAQQKECRIACGSLQPDHVHMEISIPPKYAVSQVIGVYQGQKRHLDCAHVWRAQAELCGGTLLGTGLLCLHGGGGR